jgi:hypothetical protein
MLDIYRYILHSAGKSCEEAGDRSQFAVLVATIGSVVEGLSVMMISVIFSKLGVLQTEPFCVSRYTDLQACYSPPPLVLTKHRELGDLDEDPLRSLF